MDDDQAAIERELQEVVALLDAHLPNVPDYATLGAAMVEILRRYQDPLCPLRGAERYARIVKTIREYFLGRRADGMRLIVLPQPIDQKLLSLCERAHALSHWP